MQTDYIDLGALVENVDEADVNYGGQTMPIRFRPALYNTIVHSQLIGLRKDPDLNPLLDALFGRPEERIPAEYHTHPVTGAVERDKQGNPLVKTPERVIAAQEALLVSWSLRFGNRELPCNRQNAATLPTQLLGAIANAISTRVASPKSDSETNGMAESLNGSTTTYGNNSPHSSFLEA